MKILVIDDHVLIREALRGVLKQLKGDASVLEASDCRRAMRLVEEHPDLELILLDLQLPDRDGFSVLAELREGYPAISVVVLSALHDRYNVTRALGLGAQKLPRTRSCSAPYNWFFRGASTSPLKSSITRKHHLNSLHQSNRPVI